MKALDPQRVRVVQFHALALLFLVAFFMEKHVKAHLGVLMPTGLGAALFMFAGIWGRYNLTD